MRPGPEDLKTPTIPQECVLLVAIPLTLDAFETDVANSPSDKHYAWSVCNGRSIEEAWHVDGRPVAELCTNLIDVANEKGVKVVEEASLNHLAWAAAHFRVITLISHWRGSAIVQQDINDDPQLFFEALAQTDTPVCERIRQVFPTSTVKKILSASPKRQKAYVADILTQDIIWSNDPLPGTYNIESDALEKIDQLWQASVHRELLESEFPGFLCPGDCVELRDGLCKPEVFENHIPPSWSGIIDFVVCHSAYLATKIKNYRASRRVITNNREKHPQRCLRELMECYLRLIEENMNYGGMRLRVHAEYSELLRR